MPVHCVVNGFSSPNAYSWRYARLERTGKGPTNLLRHAAAAVVLYLRYIVQTFVLQPLGCCSPAAAANMAVSWMLASGTETTVRFAQPVYPTPIVFIGSPTHIAGIPRLGISEVTSDSFRVQAFGVVCGGRPHPMHYPSTLNQHTRRWGC